VTEVTVGVVTAAALVVGFVVGTEVTVGVVTAAALVVAFFDEQLMLQQ
jgi:hypothetical protein